ncbi:hypothetical protein INT43_001448 [Umbelopsis isabellina]|uniref:Uncharacterized protein n=1 Tax=Mortierella isabellina TaxID=91625 RepID=A0A8H7PDM0_MORIS|nr:hypothetical protein INT43_001448 [Umbelopsis isabellina]
MQNIEDAFLQCAIESAKVTWFLDLEAFRLDRQQLVNTTKGDPICRWSHSHLEALHVVELKDVSSLYPFPVDIGKVHGFWQLSTEDITAIVWNDYHRDLELNKTDDDAWKDAQNDILNSCEAHEAVKLLIMYNILYKYIVQSYGQIDTHPFVTSDMCDLDRQYFAKAVCEFFLVESRKTTMCDMIWVEDSKPLEVSYYLGALCHVKTDGMILMENDNVNQLCAWIDVKPTSHSEKDDSVLYRSGIPNKAAISLAIAQRRWCQAKGGDHTVFGVEFCGHYSAFWSTFYKHEYLHNVKNSSILPADSHSFMKRSRVFDLIESIDRKEYARHFKGMLDYIASSNE